MVSKPGLHASMIHGHDCRPPPPSRVPPHQAESEVKELSSSTDKDLEGHPLLLKTPCGRLTSRGGEGWEWKVRGQGLVSTHAALGHAVCWRLRGRGLTTRPCAHRRAWCLVPAVSFASQSLSPCLCLNMFKYVLCVYLTHAHAHAHPPNPPPPTHQCATLALSSTSKDGSAGTFLQASARGRKKAP